MEVRRISDAAFEKAQTYIDTVIADDMQHATERGIDYRPVTRAVYYDAILQMAKTNQRWLDGAKGKSTDGQ